VGVQIGVSRAAVAVREGRRDHTVSVELGHSLGTYAGERHVVLDVVEGVGDGLIMNIFKGFRQVYGASAHSTEKLLTGRGQATRAIVRLKSVMAHARKMRWLTYDPAADLESPEQKAVTATAADDIWTPEQMGKFLDHIPAHRLGGCFALTLLGLRREEVGGLRWSDIDFAAGALRIRQARVDVNGRDTIVATKTKRSARDLSLPPHELAMVKAMRTFHLRERLAVGRPLADDDLLLSRADGTRLPVRDYSREFAAQRKAAGLKAITLGKLRHSNISRMRAAGVAADVVAAWHGHTERMTQAVYGRVTDDRLTAASAVFAPRAIGQS
jgi:integrase